MIRDAVRAFACEQLWPHAAGWDREHTFPKTAHKGLAELGAYGIYIPDFFLLSPDSCHSFHFFICYSPH